MSLDGTTAPVGITEDELRLGALNERSAKKLQWAWREYKSQSSKNQTAVDLAASQAQLNGAITIIILGKGFAPQHEHGIVIGEKNSSKAYYTLHIPATLNACGKLSKPEGSIPWIGRKYLFPNHEDDENIPLVGELSKYDDWLNHNPLGGFTWEEYMNWCDALWRQVVEDQVPSGFVPLKDIRIDISKSIRHASRRLCQLYDALEAEDHLPPLLKKLCLGLNHEPVEVNVELRISQLASLRGTMSTAYGLANSQADAIAAFTTMNVGDVLAVSGPPGTGKTTLLQSIIATEVVARAVAGGDPAVIVGSSMNNQPILNINDSLNKIFKENPALSLFPWAGRWVPDADTYGLYLPAGVEKTSDAIKEGYAIATMKDKQWKGFPEREADPEYLFRAKIVWIEGYSNTYGAAPDTLEAGVENLRQELSSMLTEIENIQDSLDCYHSISRWWRDTAGDLSPQAYLQKEDASLSATVNFAINDLRDKENAVAETNVLRDAVYLKTNDEILNTEKACLKQQACVRQMAGVKAKVNDAIAPQGFWETAVVTLSIFLDVLKKKFGRYPELCAAVDNQVSRPNFFNHKQITRLCLLAAKDAVVSELFEKQLHENDPGVWLTRSDHLIQAAENEMEKLRQDQKLQMKRICKEQSDIDLQWKVAQKNRDLAAKKVEEARHHRKIQLEKIRGKMQALEDRVEELQKAYATLCDRSRSEFFIEPCAKTETPSGVPGVDDFDRLLDITWRHMAFQKAMRYWEGRWILEAEALQNNKINNKRGCKGMEARFRRWCMLTPCLVVTAYSIPKHFRFMSNIGGDSPWVSNFMWDFIDLLIMDEAGQVGPHVGAGIFGLARRAVVVGDIYQIEPVSQISPGTDKANASRAGLDCLWKEGDPASSHVVSEPMNGTPMGSMMRLAQSATLAVSPETEDEPGIFLSEHRRCRPEIIKYCNKLIYQGRLKCLTSPPEKKPPLPPIAWAHVRGEMRKIGGSRENAPEAESIAKWVADNATVWCHHYDKPIDAIVAIITPFRRQSCQVRKALRQKGQQFSKVTVGTVHSLQGAEKPIIIFSPTYNADTVTGVFFDRKPNMLNVAVSRARDSFVVIGDMRLFRRQGRSPSAVLGEMMFADERCELIDVDGNHRFSRQLLVQAERISSLERHREVLSGFLERCCYGQLVLIASPWITLKAIKDDGLETLITLAVNRRGARIFIIVDRELYCRNPDHGGAEALTRLEQAGATIILAAKMHNKTLIYDSLEIIEGSFNWLSAQRKRADKFIRHEVSWRITGEGAAEAIQTAIKEFTKLGAVAIHSHLSSSQL